MISDRLRQLQVLAPHGVFLGVLVACSSHTVHKPVQVEELNTRLEVIQPLQTNNSQVVGVRDGVVVLQAKKSVPEEIRKLENEVYAIEDEIYGNRRLGNPGLYGVLKKCLTRLVDRRIGGHGKLMAIENEDRPSERVEEIKYGIDEKGRVISVNEEAASDHMARFLEYRNVLSGRRNDFETRIDVCEQDYRNALYEISQDSDQPLVADLYSGDTRQGTRDWRGVAKLKNRRDFVESQKGSADSDSEN